MNEENCKFFSSRASCLERREFSEPSRFKLAGSLKASLLDEVTLSWWTFFSELGVKVELSASASSHDVSQAAFFLSELRIWVAVRPRPRENDRPGDLLLPLIPLARAQREPVLLALGIPKERAPEAQGWLICPYKGRFLLRAVHWIPTPKEPGFRLVSAQQASWFLKQRSHSFSKVDLLWPSVKKIHRLEQAYIRAEEELNWSQ